MKPILRGPYAYKNKMERQYGLRLETFRRDGMIHDWMYEPFSVRLAKGSYYKPDFLVVAPGEFQIHETKGHKREAGIVRLKVASRLFPWFRFFLVESTEKQGLYNWKFKELEL